jgi:histidine ammonia-lyase
MKMIDLKPGELDLETLEQCYHSAVKISIGAGCWEEVEKSRAVIDKIISEKETVYGVNTGFGKLASETISPEKLEQLQENLILSHAAGVGALLPDEVVRLILLLKINALAQGYSGVSRKLIEALLMLFNEGVYPCIPAKGSVGASGDLAPLAHMSCLLLGKGEARYKDKIISAQKALEILGLDPVRLGPKEGLALINGTQVSCALALAGYFETKRTFYAALVSGGLSIDAAKGSPKPFEHRVQQVRRQHGQEQAASFYRALLDGSQIRESHIGCEKVQDPYCLRCMPQVMGSCLDHMNFAAEMFLREANAVTDNPLIFSETGDVISGGNFHAEPVGMAADTLALAIAEIGAISERRIAMLVDGSISGLPSFLTLEPGLNSGFMIAHVTAAALASENKQMSHPACVDSIPTSANQEDHVSMATHGARRLLDMADNTMSIVAIEILAATQGIEFHSPLKTSPLLESVIDKIRAQVAPYDTDRFFAPDIEKVRILIKEGHLLDVFAKIGA